MEKGFVCQHELREPPSSVFDSLGSFCTSPFPRILHNTWFLIIYKCTHKLPAIQVSLPWTRNLPFREQFKTRVTVSNLSNIKGWCKILKDQVSIMLKSQSAIKLWPHWQPMALYEPPRKWQARTAAILLARCQLFRVHLLQQRAVCVAFDASCAFATAICLKLRQPTPLFLVPQLAFWRFELSTVQVFFVWLFLPLSLHIIFIIIWNLSSGFSRYQWCTEWLRGIVGILLWRYINQRISQMSTEPPHFPEPVCKYYFWFKSDDGYLWSYQVCRCQINFLGIWFKIFPIKWMFPSLLLWFEIVCTLQVI